MGSFRFGRNGGGGASSFKEKENERRNSSGAVFGDGECDNDVFWKDNFGVFFINELTNLNMRGYTVLELMIVISTIAILSMMGIIGLRGASEREQLAAASRQLLGDLVSTRNKATSGMSKAGFSLEKSSADSYKIFKYNFVSCSDPVDCGNYCDDCPGGATDCQYCKEEIGTFYFNNPSTVPPTRSVVSIDTDFSVYFFRAPRIGKALINNDPSIDSLEIILNHAKLPFTKKIKVEGAGEAVKIYEE